MNKRLTAIIAFAIFIAAPAGAGAQTPPTQTLVTWQAETYAPESFSGKIMPTSDSAITVGVDLIDFGKRVDLSPYKVYWYLDEKFYQGAPGLSRIRFTAPHFIGETAVKVRVLIVDYKSGVGKTVNIPLVVPEVVIQSSNPGLAASAVPFTLQAYPYFFNVQSAFDLNYSWKLRGSVVGTENSITITNEMAGDGRVARLELTLNNPLRPIERITQGVNIFR